MAALNQSSILLADDEELVEMLRRGDVETGLSGLQQRYGRRIFHFVYGMLGDLHLAQDVTQEVFERVFFKHTLYRPGSNFRAWLFEVARNQALSALRARRRTPRPVTTLGDGTTETDILELLPDHRQDRSLEEKEFMEALNVAIEDLPEHYQSVFELCVRQGRPYQDAARILDLPTGTVAIRIMRARKRLFRALSHHLDRLRRPPACFQD
jgi:RNA polymerase sigma-70 factor (ECF subfamily)